MLFTRVKHNRGDGFTLIELLIVIAIIAVLSVIVVIVLNPMELLKQSRDSTRVSDLSTINSALNLFQVDNPSGSLGTVSTTYVSVPDPAAPLGGSNCSGMGFPPLPTGYLYHCAASSTYRNTDGTGWIPVDFTSISSKSPLSSLPIDPLNATSSMNYYIYTPGGSWDLATLLESQKYTQSKARNDGGYDPERYEVGTDLTLWRNVEGLAGYWTFDEGGGIAGDSSGNGNVLSWNGTGAHWASGKVGTYGAQFNGSDDYITRNAKVTGSWPQISYGAWFKTSNSGSQALMDEWSGGASFALITGNGGSGGKISVYFNTTGVSPGWKYDVSGTVSDGAWHYVVITYDGSLEHVYLDGAEIYSTAASGNLNSSSGYYFKIGAAASGLQVPSNFFNGSIDDVRIYNRALSAAEIAAIYNATK